MVQPAPLRERPRRVPIHPGEILAEEFLKPLALTQTDFAAHIGISTNRLNELVRGKRGITPDTALRLAKALGTTPQLWMNLQATWDLAHTPEPAVSRIRKRTAGGARAPG